jgi:hypothetical protein
MLRLNAACSPAADMDVRAVKPGALETPPTSLESSSVDWDLDSVAAARQSRSQSLTDARTKLPLPLPPPPQTDASVAVDGDASLVLDASRDLAHDELVARRRMRRTMSAETHASQSLSLSLLQQELGYPKPLPAGHEGKATPPSTSGGRPHRRASRRSRHSAASGDGSKDELPCGRPAATSDAPTVITSDNEDEQEQGASEEEEEEENFLDHRLASVTGYARDTDGVVYYEIIVESMAHGPLSAYKVRRRYSEFRDLHRALSKIVPTRKPKQLQPHAQRPLQLHDQPRRMSLGGLAYVSKGDMLQDTDTESLDSTRSLSRSFHDDKLHSPSPVLPSLACSLPPLPDNGGLWSYLQSESPRFLEARARAFHAIVLAAQQHPQARASRLLNKFLGPPPDSLASHHYVSLNRFAAPTLRFSIEIQERKEKAQTIRLKRRQHGGMSPRDRAGTIPRSIAE